MGTGKRWVFAVVGLIMLAALGGCIEPEEEVQAAFSAVPVTGPAPLTVQFIDHSAVSKQGIILWEWDFGDPDSGADDFSLDQNPTHVYEVPGDYSVSLTVYTLDDEDTETKTNYIAVNPAGEGETAALFDQVWQDFDVTYPYFVHKGLDWDAIGDIHRPNFLTPLDPAGFATALAATLAELRDLHVNVFYNGQSYPVYSKPWTQTWPSTPRNHYLDEPNYQTLGGDPAVIWHAWHLNDIAYIRIDDFSTAAFENISDADIENLFVRYQAAAGMIIDIRPNSGGNENNGRKFAERLLDQSAVYSRTQTRNGPAHDQFGPLQDKVLDPGSGTHFNGPVRCLIGPRCMSSAEGFTCMMKAVGARLIGANTRGASANPKEVTLSNGVTYTCSTWIAYTAEGAIIEDNGIAPDVAVAPESSVDGSHDHVLEAARTDLGAPAY
jgi:PKD repeat protein